MLAVHDGFDTPTIPLILHLIDYGIKNCDTIIIEGILKTDWYQPVWDYISKNYSENIKAYYYDVPFEETLIRHQSRPKSKEFGTDALQRWWNEKDNLAQFEVEILTSSLTLEDTCVNILSKLKTN